MEYPKYVRMGWQERGRRTGYTCLRLQEGNTYYRDAGCWSVKGVWRDGNLYSSCSAYSDMDDIPLTPCTEAEWQEDNAGYVT